MHFKTTISNHLTRAALILLALVFACATPSTAFAQNLADYAFSTGVDQNQWITLSNSATQIVTSGLDDAYSSLTDIGFNFTFGDGTYTQFWANSNGIFSFNSTPTTNYSRQFDPSNCTKNQPKICGITTDMSTGTDGYVKYELTGTSPNRVLVCEFYLFGNGSNIDYPATIKWQVQLHESTSKVVIVYGASSSDPYFFQIGLSQSGSDIWTVDPSTHEATHLTEGVETDYEVWPGENRYYEFAPLPFTISDDGNTYTINSAEGWGMFCDTLTLKPSGYFTGKTVKLGANISITQSAGSDDHRFMGTFDGQEHTLDVNITDTGEQGTAPFRFISNATIRNLHVTGTVTGTTHAAGLVGKACAGTMLIENCLVETNVNSTVGSNRHCGGIVGHGFGNNQNPNSVNLTLRNCVYAGTITCDNNYIGGLQGWSDGNTLTLENCLFAGNYQGTATGTAAFHPIALHNTGSATSLTATNVFAAVAPTATNANFIAAAGTKTTGRSTAPAGLGTQGATYSFMDMTVYENGLYYDGLYYVAPTLSTDNSGAYLINNEDDWDYFCDALYNNATWNRFSGQTVKLGADISVSRMAGYDNHDFLGTFDGNHKTLTFTATATASYLAPFRNVLGNSDTDRAVIRDLNVVTNITAHDERHMAGLIALVWGYVDVTNCNVTVDITSTKGSTNTDLYPAGIASQVVKDAQIAVSGCTVDGTISTDGKYAGGIIGIAQGSASITNCLSSVTINSSTDGDGTHGGLVGVQGNYDGKTLTIEGCVFNGQLLGASTHSCGGFVGWRSQTVNITNSLFVPVQVTINTVDGNTPCATFVRNWTMPDNANCYYTDALGTPQGTQAYSINSGENVIGVYNASGYTYTYNTSRLYFYHTGFCHNLGLSTYKHYAAAGDEVHISINTPISCADFIVEPAGIPLTLSSNGAYRFFTMPSSNVTINAAWSSSAIVSDFPWTENFNDLTDDATIPGCWNYMEIEGIFADRWGYFTTAINGYGATNGTSYDGTNCVRYNSCNNFNGTTNYLKTVPLSLPASPEMQLSFWYKNPAGGDFSVYLSTDGGDTHTTALATGLTNQQEWTPYTISLGAYAGQEVVIVFKGTSNHNYNGDAYIYLDEVNVEDVLPCAKPTRLMATILGTQRVQLGWTKGDEDQTAWQICLDDDESNLIAVESNSFILDNLAIGSTHTVKVRANCGGNDVSHWSNEVNFTMPLQEPVSYLDMNGDTLLCIDFTVLDGSQTFPLAAGWYVVEGTLNYNQTLTLSGDVHLILKDNAVMNIGTAETPVSGNGIGNSQYPFSINIYGQSTGENNGQLNVYASQYGIWAYNGDFNCSSAKVTVSASNYGIWAGSSSNYSKGNINLKDATVTVNSTDNYAIYAQGGNLNIDGGKVTATGKNYVIYAYKQYYGGNITISGSQVTANGGNYGLYASNGNINISGGQVTANGGNYGIYAYRGNITISGGQVTAESTQYHAICVDYGNITIRNNGKTIAESNNNFAICASEGNVIIESGTVEATGSMGIYGKNVNISGGQVSATGSWYGVLAYNSGSITLGWTNASDFIHANSYYADGGTIAIAEGQTFIDEDGIEHTSGTVNASDINGKTLYPYIEGSIPYIDENGQWQLCTDYTTISDNTVTTFGQNDNVDRWYVVTGTVNFTSPISFMSNSNIIIAEGAVLNVGTAENPVSGYLGGIFSHFDLKIYAESGTTGHVSVYSASNRNAIYGDGGELVIVNCEVNASGSVGIINNLTGINIVGCQLNLAGENGVKSATGPVTLKNTTLTAPSLTEIVIYSPVDLTLDSCTVVAATSATNVHAIESYGGTNGIIIKNNSNINVETTTDLLSNGIFSQMGVSIEGSTVEAKGNRGIVAGGALTITDATVKATGKSSAIWAGSSITLDGGQVTAESTSSSAICAYNGNITIRNNGKTIAESTNNYGCFAISAESGNVIIESGTVEATGIMGIYGKNVNISGGQVSATGPWYGVLAWSGNITLGWTNASDFIHANSYYADGGTIAIAEGQTFIDEDGIEHTSGTVNASDINGKKLLPYIEGSVPYLDMNGRRQLCTEFTTLDGSESTLTAGWYVADDTLDYDHTITLSGDIHLILKDNAVMNVTSTEGDGFYYYSSSIPPSISIYAQSTGESKGQLHVDASVHGLYTRNDITINGGWVEATSNQSYGIFASSGNVIINGGIVEATGGVYGICGGNSVEIHGGEVTAIGPSYGINAQPGSVVISGGKVTATATNGTGIHARYSITISGGQVTANGRYDGIYTYDGIILGWTNASDFIYASSFYINNSNNYITLSKAFKDEAGQTYSGTVANVSGAYAIDGKWLYPNTVSLFTKAVTGYGTGNGGYVLLASPVGTVNPENVANMLTNAFDLYAFDQKPSDGLEWRNYKANSFNLESGKGYLYANQENTTLVFSGTPYSGSGEVTLRKAEGARFSGWNLVGNPFADDAYLDDNRSYYAMNYYGTALVPVVGCEPIEPMEGIFVIATTDGETLTFTTTEPEPSGNKKLVLNLSRPNKGGTYTGSTTTVIDRAIVRFGEGGALPKFQLFEGSTKVYIPQDGKDYAVVNAESTGEIPVSFTAKENGTYTLSVNTENVKMVYLHLIDNMTGNDIDLLDVARNVSTVPTYTFNAKTTDYASRFKLVFVCGDANDDNETFAFINNGNIIVNGEGMLQVIDMTGRILVSRDAARHVSTTGMTPGVYVLRLINGDDIKVQKIVIP